jgi:hypothetical protein
MCFFDLPNVLGEILRKNAGGLDFRWLGGMELSREMGEWVSELVGEWVRM